MIKDDFWNEVEEAQHITKETNSLKASIDYYEQLVSQVEETELLIDLEIEENDESMVPEICDQVAKLDRKIEKLFLETLLKGKFDRHNAILSLHAGAGGTEAQDWVQMLLRMYTRWGESKDYEIEILDLLQADEAGIKSVTFMITGLNAYGFLKSEKGVHRLIRISPFDASGKRHTTFASVDVMPEIEDDIDLDINPSDLRIETFRAGGAGGQHVNKTDSAVRIIHIPTGIIAQCQNQRSQHSNRITAMKILKAKLYEKIQLEKEEQLSVIRGEQQEIAWGSQIRSYIFQPYTMVKDHRTNVEVGNVNGVMNGDLDELIYGYLQTKSQPS